LQLTVLDDSTHAQQFEVLKIHCSIVEERATGKETRERSKACRSNLPLEQ